MYKINKILITIFICIFMFCISYKVFSNTEYELIDINRKTSVTITFTPNDSAAENIEFKIYKVAEVSEMCKFTLTQEFEKYLNSLNNLDEDTWRKLAGTLAIYAETDNIMPKQVYNTNKNGEINFSDLDVGLYLIVGNEYKTEEKIYTPSPFLVCLPSKNEKFEWVYNVNSKVKYETKENEIMLSKKVMVVWDDLGNKEERPVRLGVCLYRNGELYDTVYLSVENNWRHTWYNLSSRYNWYVREESLSDMYTSTYSEEGATFVITKKYVKNESTDKPDDGGDKPSEDPDKPDDGGDKPSEDPNKPDDGGDKPSEDPNKPDDGGNKPSEDPNKPEGDEDNPSDGTDKPGKDEDDSSDGSNKPGDDNSSDSENKPSQDTEKLPATGLLWWPIPLLILLGVIMILIGIMKQKGDENEKENVHNK